MYVHADEGRAAGNAQHEIGALRAHAREGQQHRAVGREQAAEFLYHPLRNGQHLACLALMEGAGPDQGIQRFVAQPRDLFRRAGTLEQPARHGKRYLIVGAD